MTESTESTKRPRRTAAEIAQGHADKALAAVEKHDAKIEKVQDKLDQLQGQLAELRIQRAELVAEADYRQAHPALRKAQQPELDFADDGDDPAEVKSNDDEYNPFA